MSGAVEQKGDQQEGNDSEPSAEVDSYNRRMGPELTETERTVIDILIQHQQSPDAYGGPVHAVCQAMGWTTKQSIEFIRGLMERNLVRVEPIVRQGALYHPSWIWKKGEP